MQQTLILFSRAPRLGGGKSRLARDIGAVAALRFQRLMLARSVRRLGRDGCWRLRLAITPDREARPWFARLVGRKSAAPSANSRCDPGGLRFAHPPYIVPQARGDLGE